MNFLKKNKLFIYILTLTASILMLLSFFIPYVTAIDDFRDDLESNEYYIYYDGLYIESEDLIDLSFYDYASATSKLHNIENRFKYDHKEYSSIRGVSYDTDFFFAIVIIIAVLSFVNLILTIIKNNIGSIIVSAFVFGLLLLTILSDVTGYSFINDNYAPYFGIYTYFISVLLVIICSTLQYAVRDRTKKVKPIPVIINQQSNNWICPNCHNISFGNFCNICGSKRALLPNNKFCPKCGTNISLDAGFCKNCGKKF